LTPVFVASQLRLAVALYECNKRESSIAKKEDCPMKPGGALAKRGEAVGEDGQI